MSSVDAISTKGLGYSALSAVNTDKKSEMKDTFSAILKQMQTGGGAGSGKESDSDEDTATVTQVLADGSVIITVYQGDEIISQTKSKSSSPDENAQVLSTRYDADGNVITTIEPAAQNLATGSASALMLTALTQN